MSNFRTIATVTEALRQMLIDPVDKAVAGAQAKAVKPTTGTPSLGVNLYLYQVGPNAALRNHDLPTRRDDGTPMQRPKAALELHYLLTFYGDEAQLEPQKIMGKVVETLHSRPVLSRAFIRSAEGVVGPSGLANEVEHVKFTPLNLSLEELSKLWSVFFQTTYSLSFAYQASVVLIEAEDEIPKPTLPVLKPQLHVISFEQPVLERVLSQSAASQAALEQPIVLGQTLVLQGYNLRGQVTKVRIGNQVVAPGTVSNHKLHVPLTFPPLAPNSLRAGVQTLQVIHDLDFGTPDEPHRGFESNVAAFVLRPGITPSAFNQTNSRILDGVTYVVGTLAITFDPRVERSQKVALLLNQHGATPAKAYRIEAPDNNGIDNVAHPNQTDTATITFEIKDLPSDDYLLRAQVDGAESLLQTVPNSTTFSGPTVSLI